MQALIKLWKNLRPRGLLEYLAIALTLIAVPYWLAAQGWSWKAIGGAPLLIICGYMAGGMVYDLWVPRRR